MIIKGNGNLVVCGFRWWQKGNLIFSSSSFVSEFNSVEKLNFKQQEICNKFHTKKERNNGSARICKLSLSVMKGHHVAIQYYVKEKLLFPANSIPCDRKKVN